MSNLRRRVPIAVEGELVDVACVGSLVFLQTTVQLYVTHVDWIPAIDDVSIARIRELYAIGDLSTYEIAARFDVSRQTVWECVHGQGRYAYLTRVPRPPNRSGRRTKHEERTL